MKKIFGILLSLIFINPIFAFDKDEKHIISIYEKINPAIVCVDSHVSDGISCGTGCIIHKSGIILTSAHVVETGDNVIVTMSNGKDYNARVLKRFGEKKDIALLKINVPIELQTVKLGNSEKIKVGQKVLAIGNPFGFNGTLTQGIISRIDYERNKIQTDAAINPGCSGGPLLNLKGEIIGINQSIYNPDSNRSNIGIGFALPSNYATEFISKVSKKVAIQ